MSDENLLPLAETEHAIVLHTDDLAICPRYKTAPFSDVCHFLGIAPLVDDDLENCCTYMEIDASARVHQCGDRLEHVYIIAAGVAKVVMKKGGGNFIAGFFLPGEMLGLDGVDGLTYPGEIIALTDLLLLRVPYPLLLKYCKHYPALDKALVRIFADRIAKTTTFMEVLARARSEVKVAYFLNCIAIRLGSQVEPAVHLDFFIPRRDIADYLGIAYETLSRILREFCELGIIGLSRSKLSITDHFLLRDMCGAYAERLKVYQDR